MSNNPGKTMKKSPKSWWYHLDYVTQRTLSLPLPWKLFIIS